MQIRIYPNRQIECRIPPPSPLRGVAEGAAERALVNSQKLAIENLPPAEACKYPSCPWPRPGYGGVPLEREFSFYAKKQICRVGGVFADSSCGRSVFLTGTLPGSTDAALDAISRYSSWTIHELLTRIPRLIGIKASELRWVWVWEYQSRGALHWHCVLEAPSFDLASLLIERFGSLWCSVIDGLSAISGVDCAARRDGKSWAGRHDRWKTDAQRVEGEPYKYLVKYLCKTSSFVKVNKVFPPCRWYGASRRALSDLRAKTIVLSSPRDDGREHWEILDVDLAILNVLSSSSNYLSFWKDKFGTGQSFSFSFDSVEFDECVSFLQELIYMAKPVAVVRDKWKPEPGKPSEYVVWADVDRCLADRRLSERLFNDIGAHYVSQLNLYVRGKPSIWGDMYWVDRHAQYLLYLRYGRSDVNSGSAPVGGLTSNASKTLGKEDWPRQLDLVTKLPF